MSSIYTNENITLLKGYLNRLTNNKFKKNIQQYEGFDLILKNSLSKNQNNSDTLTNLNKKIIADVFNQIKQLESETKFLSRDYEQMPQKPNSNVQYSNNFDSKPPNNVEFSDNKKETENLPDTKMVYDNIMQQRKYEDEQLYTTQKKDSEEAMSWLNQHGDNKSTINSQNLQNPQNSSTLTPSVKQVEERYLLLENENGEENRVNFVKTFGYVKKLQIKNLILNDKQLVSYNELKQKNIKNISNNSMLFVEVLINNVSVGSLVCFKTDEKNSQLMYTSYDYLTVDDLITKIEFRFFDEKRKELNISYNLSISNIYVGSSLMKSKKRIQSKGVTIDDAFLKMDYKYINYDVEFNVEHDDVVRIQDDNYELLGHIFTDEKDEDFIINTNVKVEERNTLIIKNTNSIDENSQVEILTKSPKFYLHLM